MAKSAAGNHWNSEGATSPEQWNKLDPAYVNWSGGRHQSPINLTVTTRASLEELHFHYAPSAANLVNTGPTVQVNYDPGSYLAIGSRRYDLLQFHFHSPSEHRVDGKAYPLEVHLVHRAPDGELAVVGIFMAVSSENRLIGGLLENRPLQGKAHTGAIFDVSSLIPPSTAYFAYTGSMTTPPYNERVRWIILQTPAPISAAQVGSFTDRFPRNARPVQPLNDRVVFEGFYRR